MGNSFPGS